MHPTRAVLYIVVAVVFVCSGLYLGYKKKNNHVNLFKPAFWFILGFIGTYVFTSK